MVTAGTLTTDRFGRGNSALAFDGTGGGVVSARAIGLGGAAARTISLWLYADILLPHMCLVGYGLDYAGEYCMLETVAADSEGSSTFVFNGSWANVYAQNSSFVVGKWQHLAISCDGAIQNVYVNGELKGYGSLTLSTADTVLRAGSDTSQSSSDWNLPFKGKLDDIRVYSRFLSAAEIAVLFSEGNYAGAGSSGNGNSGSTTTTTLATATTTTTTTTVAAPSLRISYPTAATTWGTGYSKTIDWHSENIDASASMKLELLYNGRVERIIASSTANDGAYTWTVSATHPGPAVFSGGTPNGYSIKITYIAKPNVTAESPEFRIYTANTLY